MRIIKLNVGSNIIDISQSLDSGTSREYIDLGIKSKKQSDLIISLAGKLSESNYEFVGIESKYMFGKRNKRLEIVFKDEKTIHVIKISKQKKFDKDAIDLDNLITDIINKYKISIKGIILLTDDFDSKVVNDYSNSMKNIIEFFSFNKFKEEYGIFDK